MQKKMNGFSTTLYLAFGLIAVVALAVTVVASMGTYTRHRLEAMRSVERARQSEVERAVRVANDIGDGRTWCVATTNMKDDFIEVFLTAGVCAKGGNQKHLLIWKHHKDYAAWSAVTQGQSRSFRRVDCAYPPNDSFFTHKNEVGAYLAP